MSDAGGAPSPTQDTRLLLIPDALIPGGQADGQANEHEYTLHPALQFISTRLCRAAKMWSESEPRAPIEWYARLLGVDQGASCLLADAMGDTIPADARQCWFFSPFAGRLGRDRVHIMPEEMFAWDKADTEWLVGMLQPLLAGDGLQLLVRGNCMLAVSSSIWDVTPASLARVAGHVLPNRHPDGADGGRLMRLCAEMQMLLATHPSQRRRDSGLPDVMGVWLWAPSVLPVEHRVRPRIVTDNALVRACTADADTELPLAILQATQVEAWLEHQGLPRYWLLGGERHMLLLDLRALPRFGRDPWWPKQCTVSPELVQRLRRIAGLDRERMS